MKNALELPELYRFGNQDVHERILGDRRVLRRKRFRKNPYRNIL